MTKYRIVQRGTNFHIQAKFICFWYDVYSPGMEFKSLEAAIERHSVLTFVENEVVLWESHPKKKWIWW